MSKFPAFSIPSPRLGWEKASIYTAVTNHLHRYRLIRASALAAESRETKLQNNNRRIPLLLSINSPLSTRDPRRADEMEMEW